MTETAMRMDELGHLLSGHYPDSNGRFGPFGGRYVPETLVPAITGLESAMREALADPSFQAELGRELSDFVGRPTPRRRETSASAGASSSG